MLKFNRFYIIIFSLSLTTLTFEITLARVFSYILTYHFVFIIIAFAILALALGQLYASRAMLQNPILSTEPSAETKNTFSRYFILLQILFPISLFTVFILPSFESIGTGSTGLIIYIILAGITFFLVGIISAYIFQVNGNKSGVLYAFDMIGAAIGSLTGLFLLDNFNILQTLAVILLIISIASIFSINYVTKKSRAHQLITAISFLLSFYIIFMTPNVEMQIAKSTDKDLLRLKSNPSVKTEIIETRWNSFGRTDLVEFTYPDASTSRSMFIDGAAGTEVVDISELEKDSIKLGHTLAHSNLFFPFYFLEGNEKDSALIIGPGGGYDIAMAYLGGVKNIDAVEVNPTFIDLMKQYNKSTFTEKPNINIFVQEGRNFARNTINKSASRAGMYDLLFLTIPITKGVRSTDFINLTENYLFTQEALKDYLSVLTEEGRIVFTLHNNEEVYKVLSNYLDMQSKEGVSNSDAFKYVYVADRGMKPLLVIKKNPFTKADIEARHFISHKLQFDKGVSFFPFFQQMTVDTVVLGRNYRWTMFDNVLYDVSKNKYDFHTLAEDAMINLHPVYDDSPFFFNYEPGIPQNLNPLIFAGIILAVGSVYMFKKSWGIKFNNSSNQSSSGKSAFNMLAAIAFLLGFAYIFTQSYLFQKLNLQLSNPLQSFSMLLFTFLLGNGIGSFLTNLVKKKRLNFVGISVLITMIVITLEMLFMSYNSSQTLSEPILALIVFIPAVFIGMPFPLILAESNQFGGNNGVAILLGISGTAGFIGSVIVLAVAITSGYLYVIAFSLIMYVTILVLLISRKKKFYKLQPVKN